MFAPFVLSYIIQFYSIMALVPMCCNFGNSYELLVWYT